jgi:alanine-glyoxylate transaminase/serine-glyoxylate transaminase/serine-pyruvate transaminase
MLPSTTRVLLGPGPSVMSPRVMRAMSSPVLSHLDPDFLALMDDLRARLARVFRAPDGSFAFAVSGTGTAGMETVVANLIQPGTRVLAIVTGYFGDRLAQMCARHGAEVTRLDVEWGRAVDPDTVARALAAGRADIVCVVHAETSTGVLNDVKAIAALAHQHGALVIVDAVTSLGGMPLDVAAWGLDAVYSCSQKGVGAPSGLAPVVFAPRALERRVPCRSFYFDLGLLEDYWVRRRYHHTMSSSLIYALAEALLMVEEEGLDARWVRHEQNHLALVAGVEALGLSMLVPAAERLWTLNTVRVPEGVDDAAVRRRLLHRFDMEIGAGLGPLAGKIFRIGLMGNGSTPAHVALCLAALGEALRAG